MIQLAYKLNQLENVIIFIVFYYLCLLYSIVIFLCIVYNIANSIIYFQITYSAIQKLSKPNSLNYKIEEGKFSASKTYRIMQIIDACKTKGSFHKEDEDEVWVILKRNQNLLKMEEYIYNRGKQITINENIKRFQINYIKQMFFIF